MISVTVGHFDGHGWFEGGDLINSAMNYALEKVSRSFPVISKSFFREEKKNGLRAVGLKDNASYGDA